MNNWIIDTKNEFNDIVCPFCTTKFTSVECPNDYKYCPTCGNRIVTFKPTYESDKKFIEDCKDMLDWSYSNSYEVPIDLPIILCYAIDRVEYLISS